ncbi:unnamed protein product [Calicophoron daubneyi]|uniref:NR LBD domain-containing protein n=1 Tax=Calicophoron daubneyi TaxID=300641 RepID=A0AAV2TBC7_CALDB
MSSTPPAGISSSSEVPLRSQTGDKNSKPYFPRSSEDPSLLLLGNSHIISARSSHPDIAEIARQTTEQLYQPMQDLCLEDVEIACLRAIVLFDPSSSRNLVRGCQYLIQLELMHLMNDKLYLPQGRFGALLLILPDLRIIANHMVDKLQLAKKMGLTRLDGLLTEILLSNTCNTEAKAPTTVSVLVQPEEQCEIFQDSISEKAKLELPRNSPTT